ncbi:hypothetical protein ACI3PL_28585, partial [Lacticaseibacillus paracasei]
VSKAQDKFSKDYISATKMDELIESAINKYLDSSKADLEKLNKALAAQGLFLRGLQGGEGKEKTIASIFKNAFNDQSIANDLK